MNKYKIMDSIWTSTPAVAGMVVVENDEGDRKIYWGGIADPTEEDKDAKKIIEMGMELPPAFIRHLLGEE